MEKSENGVKVLVACARSSFFWVIRNEIGMERENRETTFGFGAMNVESPLGDTYDRETQK